MSCDHKYLCQVGKSKVITHNIYYVNLSSPDRGGLGHFYFSIIYGYGGGNTHCPFYPSGGILIYWRVHCMDYNSRGRTMTVGVGE